MRDLLRLVALALAAAFFVLGCDYPPSFEYVEEPPPPARSGDFYGIEVAASSAVPVVLIANDHSKLSGASAATGARSRDESIAKVVASTRDATVHEGAPAVTGTVFVVIGIAPGETQIDVVLDGDAKGSLAVKVVPQDAL